MPRSPEFDISKILDAAREVYVGSSEDKKSKIKEKRKKKADELLDLFKPEDTRQAKEDASQWGDFFFGKDKSKQKELRKKIRSARYEKKDIKTAREYYKEAENIAREANRIRPGYSESQTWLPKVNTVNNPIVVEFSAKIAILPRELQNDPNILYSELVRAHQSFDWATATREEAEEFKKLIQSTVSRVEELRQHQSLPEITPESLERQLSGKADIYRSEKLSEDDQKTKGGSAFHARMERYQRVIDNTRDENDERLHLRELRRSLLKDMMLEPSDRVSDENINKYLNIVDSQLNLVEQEITSNKERRDFRQDPRIRQERQALNADWLTQGVDDINNPELTDLLNRINNEIDFNDTNSVKEQVEKLENFKPEFVNDPTKSKEENDREFEKILNIKDTISRYQSNIRLTYARQNPAEMRYQPQFTAEQLVIPALRDEEFYRLLQNIIGSPNSSSDRLLNFQLQTTIDSFIESVREANGIDGFRIAQEYRQRRDILINMHDLDYTARLIAEPEKFAGIMKGFPSEYLSIAMSDPYVEALYRIREQVLRIIRDSNNGYIPPEFVVYGQNQKESLWDKMSYEMLIDMVKKGALKDYERDGSGFIIPNTQRVVKEDEIKNLELRIKASMVMAQGIGIATGRYLEIFASAKSPGFARKEYEIAKYMNPIQDLFLKFKLGGQMHLPFFYSLLGIDSADYMNYFNFNPKRWQEIVKAIEDGEYQDYLRDIEGIYRLKGKEVPENIADMANKFFFDGVFGPNDSWREAYSTAGWDERDFERLGTSPRLKLSKEWAKNRKKKNGGDDHEHGHHGESNKEAERAYKAYVWIQAAMRNPLDVALTVEEAVKPGKDQRKKLRDSIIFNILEIELPTDEISKNVKYPKPLSAEAMRKIQILEQDVFGVQQLAMTGGPDGRPRNLKLSDFDVIPEGSRRKNAKMYWELTQKALLGRSGEDVDKYWFDTLGIKPPEKAGDELIIEHIDKLHELTQSGNKLTNAFLDRKPGLYDTTTDIHFKEMKFVQAGRSMLSSRMGDEFATRAKTVQGGMQHLSLLKPHITHEDEQQFIKSIEAMATNERGVGPDSSMLWAYTWGRATSELYRQQKWAAIPIVGRILGSTGWVPMSIAQVFGGRDGTYWSANNTYHFNHEISNRAGLPHHGHGSNGEHYEFNLERLNKETAATPRIATAEAIIIGGVLAGGGLAGLAIYSGIAKADDDSSESGHGDGGGHGGH